MPSVDVHAFVVANLPPAPARVLEVGAGPGELARDLRRRGYDVLAIDPHADAGDVVPVALADVDDDGPFDAAVAIVSLHHVEPLEPSLRRLAELVRPGGMLLVDEVDFAALDLRAATWLVERWREIGRETRHTPEELIASHGDELHSLEDLRRALAQAFDLAPPIRGSYLYRWHLEDRFRPDEEAAIVAGELPAVGARFTGVRRS